MHNCNCSRRLYSQVMIAIFTVILGSVVLWPVPLAILFSKPMNVRCWGLLVLVILVLLLGFHYREVLTAPWRSVLVGLTLAVLLVFGLNAARLMRWNVMHPPEWDFVIFWLDGQVAAQGLNFYEPQFYQNVTLTFTPTNEFVAEVLEVGFRYPPPTMFLFLPLSLFDVHMAFMLWYIVHSLILILDIILLWKIFLSKSGLMGLVLVTVLVATLFGTMSTIHRGQTNFLALLMLLLFWRDRTHQRGGVWLALGILIKPFLAVLLIYPVLRKHWRVIISTFITLIVISLLAFVAFGPETFLSYFTENPNANAADFQYTQMFNQSLLATILRLTDYNFGDKSPLTHPIFIALVFILTGITGWLVYRLDETHNDWALALTLLLSLLIYPASQIFYSVLLIIPILLLWMHRQSRFINIWGVVAFIALVYALVSYHNGEYVFIANALTWFVLAGIGIRTLMRPEVKSGASQIYNSTA